MPNALKLVALLASLALSGCANVHLARNHAAQPNQAVVKVYVSNRGSDSSGSGVIIGPGRLATAYHVIENAQSIHVEIMGEETRAYPVFADPEHDLAVLSFPARETPHIPLLPANYGLQDMGVTLVGYPFGGAQTSHHASVQGPIGNYGVYLNSPVMQGESGGAMITRIHGKFYLAGIITSSVKNEGEHEVSGGAAVPSNYIRRFLTSGRTIVASSR